jgi:hypothetical protein
MTFTSGIFYLGFTVLVALGVFALGLILTASMFALIAAGMDIARRASVMTRYCRVFWRGFGENGRQFALCWIGILLCFVLGAATVLSPRQSIGTESSFDGFDLLGIALCIPALAQIVGRFGRKRA